MSTELQDAFARASQVAKAEFETRNAVEVIEPAARRVTRYRVAIRLGAGLASVAVVGAVLWGADTFADSRISTINPAVPTADGAGLGIDPNPDIAPPNDSWTGLDLALRTKARTLGGISGDATAGMICHHEQPSDDPRIGAGGEDLTTSQRISLENCSAVWFVDGPRTDLTNWSVSASEADHSLTYSFSVHNGSAQPIAIDADSVFMWVETSPTVPSDTAAQYESTLVGGSMWDLNGDVTALLNSSTVPAIIGAGGDYSSAIKATTGSADGDPLAAVLASGQPYRVSLWARVHDASPNGDTTYLIELGSDNDTAWSLAGSGLAS